MAKASGYRHVRMGRMDVTLKKGEGGVIYARSTEPLPAAARSMTDRLAHWARERPDAVFLADRGEDWAWRRLTYGEAWAAIQPIAQRLLDAGLSAERPLVILSGNEIEHALLGLAAMLVGVPYAPLAPAYSIVSKDFAKLRHVADLLEPGMIYASDGERFAPAIDAVFDRDIPVIVRKNRLQNRPCERLDDIRAGSAADAVDGASAAVGPDTIAKFLFTSGSTGMPKAVITTQRMLTCNQEMIRSALAFLADEPPVMVDWMPWNHVAAGSHNFGIVLYNGGTYYIDDGVATPEGILRTVRNLEEVSPTFYSNVPKGYELLVGHLSDNPRLRESFFKDLKVLQYAGASLAQHVWDGLDAAATSATGERIMIITGYGSTETAPFAFTTTWAVDRAGLVGLPAAGLEIKLVPNAEKLELRLKGPSITPGYWKQPDKTAESFDEEGFYKIGDALKFADPDDVSRGFVFDGRVTEDFKLSTGTWVNTAGVRSAAIAACKPMIRDIVLTGADRNYLGGLIFPDLDACRRHAGLNGSARDAEVVTHPEVIAFFQDALDALAAQATGSASHIARAVLLDSPPSMEASEVTDKGSINQRAVMAARADKFEALYADPAPECVLQFKRKGA
ncbi:feruloyl-CoA synthase [Pelagibacterium xiamenense]|uniref:feruloyl-CoA synthase n=1 Tax=Pelagibacterium xiamenense TaxID=2901140 RepID=UPI001E333AFF|nr:feruloyl-CoA synthase [Pelagibacterium xiamenense]MCD7059008.1 feruloyl-CoA synthase [Pelagibacterium xiamenense]